MPAVKVVVKRRTEQAPLTPDRETPVDFVRKLALLPTYREKVPHSVESILSVLDGLIYRARVIVQENEGN